VDFQALLGLRPEKEKRSKRGQWAASRDTIHELLQAMDADNDPSLFKHDEVR
jgi:hypothetical protein